MTGPCATHSLCLTLSFLELQGYMQQSKRNGESEPTDCLAQGE